MADLFSTVKGLVDKLDPEGLLASGAPADEYDHETRAMVDKATQMLAARPDMAEAEFIKHFLIWLVLYWTDQFGRADAVKDLKVMEPVVRSIYLVTRRRLHVAR